MQEGDKYHGVCRPSMDVAEYPSARDVKDNLLHRRIGCINRWGIVNHQQHSGNKLNSKEGCKDNTQSHCCRGMQGLNGNPGTVDMQKEILRNLSQSFSNALFTGGKFLDCHVRC